MPCTLPSFPNGNTLEIMWHNCQNIGIDRHPALTQSSQVLCVLISVCKELVLYCVITMEVCVSITTAEVLNSPNTIRIPCVCGNH
jgi:hypothetical protein